MPSRFQELFGDGGVRGRPTADEAATGLATGDPKITEVARRRATRVLKVEHQEEFEELMREEAEYLKSQTLGGSLPVGKG